MRMTKDATRWLEETTRRITSGHGVPPERLAAVEAEIRSHLHTAAAARATARGRQEVRTEDLAAALRETGGERGVQEAFLDRHRRAFGADEARAAKAGLAVWLVGPVLGVAAAGVALASMAGNGLPAGAEAWLAIAGVALAAAVLALVAATLAHVARRRDLDRGERWLWAVALVLLGPFTAVAYLRLGKSRSRRVAGELLRVLRRSEPPA